MQIFTTSDRVDRLRRNIVELVLSDYPNGTNGADQNGSLPIVSPLGSASPHGYDELQSVVAQVGLEKVRYRPGKNHLDQPEDNSHPYMFSDLSKCIMCYRCVRACDEIQGEFVLAAHGRLAQSPTCSDRQKPCRKRPSARFAPIAALAAIST